MTWLKKVLHLGIGERWLVISLLAAVGLPVGALVTLLVLGTGSLAVHVGRPHPASAVVGRRSRSPTGSGRSSWRRWTAASCCPTASAGGSRARPDGRERFLWVRPALLRAGEYAGVLALTALLPGTGPGAAACLLLLVVASHHYDDLYRVLNGLHPPAQAARLLGLGWPGRLLVVAVLSVVGGSVGEGGLWLLAAALGMLYLVIEPAGVMREVRSRQDMPTGGGSRWLTARPSPSSGP